MGLVLKESVVRRIIVEFRADNPARAGRALTKDQKKTTAEHALPSFVMRGYVLLRLPDQKTMTGRVNA